MASDAYGKTFTVPGLRANLGPEPPYKEPKRAEQIETIEEARARIADLEAALIPFSNIAMVLDNARTMLLQRGLVNIPEGGNWFMTDSAPPQCHTAYTAQLFYFARDTLGRTYALKIIDDFHKLQAETGIAAAEATERVTYGKPHN